jgi:hypothetical protein
MKRILCLFVLGAVGACSATAQNAASAQAGASMDAQAGAQVNSSNAQVSGSAAAKTSTATPTKAKNKKAASPATIADGTKIDATLVSWVDAGRSRIGDPVQARIEQDVKQGGKVVLKKGAHLTGHVTEARTRAKGQGESEVGIMFERALVKDGQSIPFHASIVAIAARQSAAAAAEGADNMMASGSAMGATQASARGGGLAGGLTSTTSAATGAVMSTAGTASSTAGSAAGTMSTMAHSSGAVGGLTSSGRLGSNSSGVFGLEGLSLNSAASSATQGSMVVSNTKNVHLDSGTQMLLRTSAQAQ